VSQFHQPKATNIPGTIQDHVQTWDAVETYFNCITECSLEDGACIARCVEELRDGAEPAH
jgi:hypothetical protein